MKSRWLVAGVLCAFAGAAAFAQTQQQSQQGTTPPPPQQQAAPPDTQKTAPPAAAPKAPATSKTKTQTQPGRTSSNPVPSSEALQPPETPIKGQVVEELVARVNNEIITTLDYQRARG